MEQSLQAMSKQERLENWTARIAACRGSGRQSGSGTGKTVFRRRRITTGGGDCLTLTIAFPNKTR